MVRPTLNIKRTGHSLNSQVEEEDSRRRARCGGKLWLGSNVVGHFPTRRRVRVLNAPAHSKTSVGTWSDSTCATNALERVVLTGRPDSSLRSDKQAWALHVTPILAMSDLLITACFCVANCRETDQQRRSTSREKRGCWHLLPAHPPCVRTLGAGLGDRCRGSTAHAEDLDAIIDTAN